MTFNLDLPSLKTQRVHFPVMIQEVLDNLLVFPNTDNKIFVDCTFGAGGYTELILHNSNARVISFDRDTSVLPHVERIKALYGDRFTFIQNRFSTYAQELPKIGVTKLDGIVMDLGFSNMQISSVGRGFSFKDDTSLSMEMGFNKHSAYDVVNKSSSALLSDIIYNYGEDKNAHQIANSIVNYRQNKPIETAFELAQIIRKVAHAKKSKTSIDPATKAFQAFRIYVNDELHELQSALNNSLDFLNPQGRLLVVSFHSLEDRIVKNFFNEHGKYQKYLNNNDKFTKYKETSNNMNHILNILTKKPLCPTEEEISLNSPSSSAKLRVASRV